MTVDQLAKRPSSSVWAVILAAGGSSRFGTAGPKQLVPFAGEPLVAHLTRTVLSSRAAKVLVVAGYRALEVAQAVTRLGVAALTNDRYAEGQSTSVIAAIRAIGPSATGVIFIPCDQPYLTRELIDYLIAQFESSEAPLVIPTVDGERRSPVVVGRGLFPELEELKGDQGARQLFPRYEDGLIEVPWPDRRALADFNTQEEFERLLTSSAEMAELSMPEQHEPLSDLRVEGEAGPPAEDEGVASDGDGGASDG